MTHVRFVRRSAATSALTAALLGILIAAPAIASTTVTDPRWLPWIGCWMPTTATSEIASSLSVTQRVCVMPSDSGTGVEVVGVVDGAVISRVHVDASGEQRPVSREGCEGWETARWSRSAGRVYLRSEVTCAGGVKRVSSGVIAIASPSDWVDVEVVSVNDQKATRVIRYRSAPDSTAVDRQIAAAVGEQEMARRSARMAAAALPGIADVIEASRELDAAVVEAWLLQRMPRFAVDVRELRQLAGARVPGSVIDLVVALSRPEIFQDRLATRGYTLVRIDAALPRVVAMESQTPAEEYVMPPSTGSVATYEGYSSSHRGRCGRCTDREIIYYDLNPYSYGYYPYWPYGLYPLYPVYPVYPYPYPSPYPRPPQQQKPAPRGPVIVHEPGPRPPGQQPTTPAPDQVEGRAIKGKGYTRSTDGGTAEPPPPQQVVPAESRPQYVTPPEPPPRAATESRPTPPTREYTPPPAREYTPPPAPPSREYTPPSPPPRTATPRREPEARPRPTPPPDPQPTAKPAPPPPPAATAKPDPPARTAKTRPPSRG